MSYPFSIGRQPRRAFRLAPPESEPQLIFNGATGDEPPEVASFRDLLTSDAKGLQHALDAKRGRQNADPPHYDVAAYAGIIDGIVSSPHWQGRPPGLWVDQTTSDRSLTSAEGRRFGAAMGRAAEGSEAYTAAQQGMRIHMLAELATRAVAVRNQEQGIIFQAPQQRAA